MIDDAPKKLSFPLQKHIIKLDDRGNKRISINCPFCNHLNWNYESIKNVFICGDCGFTAVFETPGYKTWEIKDRDFSCPCLKDIKKWSLIEEQDIKKYGHTPDCEGKYPFLSIAPANDPKNVYVDRIENIAVINEMIMDSEESYIISTKYMSEKEYRSLREFTGF